MNKKVVSLLSALFLTGAISSGFSPQAKAVLQMNFTAPFISDAGLANALGSQHYFTVFVTSVPLEGFKVNLPNEMRVLEGVRVEDQNGGAIAAKTTINEGTVDLIFDRPVEPETYLTVKLDGVETDRTQSFVMYRVFGMWQDLDGTIPIGTARVGLRNKT